MADKPKKHSVRTFDQVARALGESPSNVAFWAKHHGAPIVSGAENDLDEIRAWLTSFRATNPAKANTKSESSRKLAEAKLAAEVQGLVLRNEAAKLKLQKQKGGLIPVADAEAEQRNLARTVKRALMGLAATLSGKLVGKSKREIETALRIGLEDCLAKASQSLLDESEGLEPTS